jgi:antitoxin HicB
MMTKMEHPNHGASLEDVLAEDGNLEYATTMAVKRVIAWQLQQEMANRHLTKTAMAKKMETTRKQLDRILSPDDGNVTIETLQRAARAVGRTLRLELA